MEEEKIIFNETGEFEPDEGYQRHSKKSKRDRSNSKRDDDRFGHSKDHKKTSSKRRKHRVRKHWS